MFSCLQRLFSTHHGSWIWTWRQLLLELKYCYTFINPLYGPNEWLKASIKLDSISSWALAEAPILAIRVLTSLVNAICWMLWATRSQYFLLSWVITTVRGLSNNTILYASLPWMLPKYLCFLLYGAFEINFLCRSKGERYERRKGTGGGGVWPGIAMSLNWCWRG